MKSILTNYHTHSHFCDGQEAPETYVQKAIAQGFYALGFSGHAPVLFANQFSIPDSKLLEYCSEIERLKTKYASQIHLYQALEADFIPMQSYDFDFFRLNHQLDYIIGSIHLVAHPHSNQLWFIDGGEQAAWDKGLAEVFGGDIRQAVTAFYQQTNRMIETQTPEIIGHLDKIKMHNKNRLFTQQEDWYQNLVLETLSFIKEKNLVLEINTRGLYKGRSDELFPSIPIVKIADKMGIPLMLNTDAHHPNELTGFYFETKELLKMSGIKELWHFSLAGWFSSTLD
jgi:histidinol-phosphatase (PHP family)